MLCARQHMVILRTQKCIRYWDEVMRAQMVHVQPLMLVPIAHVWETSNV